MMASQPDHPEAPAETPRPEQSHWQVVHRIVRVRKESPLVSLRPQVTRFFFPASRLPGWKGYVAALVGVALASLLIGLIEQVVHIANISLIYLPVVLWLATAFGWAPAFLASVLAFLTYDFFFIPPFYRLTVDDPSEWLS